MHDVTVDEDLNKCSIAGCPFPSVPHSWHGPGGTPLGGYCLFHSRNLSTYGQLKQPTILSGRNACTHVEKRQRTDRPTGETAEVEISCHEPAVGNQLCVLHISEHHSDIRDVWKSIALWQRRPNLSTDPFISDEPWRVLREIDRISNVGPSIPTLPDPEGFFDMMTQMMTGRPLVKDVVKWGFYMSPYSIGEALVIDYERVRYHLRHLYDAGYLQLDPEMDYASKYLIVTRSYTMSNRRYGMLRWRKFRNHFPSKWMKQEIGDIPRPRTQIRMIEMEGPGDVKPEYQGQLLSLTHAGRLQLSDFNARTARDNAEEKRKRRDRLLTWLLVVLTLFLMVSVIADLPRAIEVVSDWFHGNPIPA